MKQQMSKEEWAEQSKARVDAALETLTSAIEHIVTGDDWRTYLDFQVKFHSYSPNNIMLLSVQHAERFRAGLTPNPTPSYMAGFSTWRQLGRTVDKGQKGYAVLAPILKKSRLATAPDGETRYLSRGEQPKPDETEKARSGLVGFKVEYVFEASQTSGATPLPEPPRPQLLHGEAPEGLGHAVMELIECVGYTVSTVPDAAAIQGANGQTTWSAKSVVVRADMDDAAITKTLIHEAAHVLLHAEGAGFLITRSQMEIEAESVAYVVSAAHGMPSDEYSFPYVASWAASANPEKSIRMVRDAQSRISSAAKLILAASPAPHEQGGRLPAAAIQAAQVERSRMAVTAAPAPLPSDAVQIIPVGMGVSI